MAVRSFQKSTIVRKTNAELLHNQLLDRLVSCDAGLEIRFESHGSGGNLSYHIIMPAIALHAMRVFANGELQACVDHVRQSNPERAKTFLRLLHSEDLVRNKKSEDCPWIKGRVETIDLSSLVSVLGKTVRAK